MAKTFLPRETEIEQALERFNLAAEADNGWRTECLIDLRFSTADQWDLGIRTQRERNGKPCLTMDQIQQSVRLVCNQYRQQPPAIDVSPVGDEADVPTAEILQGIIRHIEVNCDAQVTYEDVHEGIVRTGFKSCRLLSEYVDDDSDEQEILIEPIRNQFNVFWQPGVPQHKAKWCFIIEDLPRDTYKEEYGDDELASADEFTSIGNAPPAWVTADTIRVAEYFCLEAENPTHKRSKNKVVWRKINAFKTLEGPSALPGTTIPVFTAYGDDLDVNGERYVAGLVRNARGPQQMYNYMNSKAVEAIALAPTAPWVVAEGQLSGREKDWEQANSGNIAVLQYKQVDISGKPAPPPSRSVVEPAIQSTMLMIRQESLDLKAAMGIYDPSLGQRRGDESGTAIQHLQQQGNIATLNYADNMSRMMKRLGRSLLEWIRIIYDVPRVQRIIKPDGTIGQVITHNGPDQADAAQKLVTDKISKIYDIGVGRYDVIISVGPTYQSKRQQASETQLQLLQHMPPQMVPMFMDLVIRNMDIPQAAEMADRAKKLLPPALQDGDESDPKTQVNKLQSQIQQLSQQHQQLTQALEHSNQIIQTKQVEQQGKTQIEMAKGQNDLTIEKMKIDAQIAIAEINTKAQSAVERAQMFKDIWTELHGSAHELGMQATQNAHEQGMAAQQQGADAQSQASDQAADSQSQASAQNADSQSQVADQAHQQQMAQQNQESQ